MRKKILYFFPANPLKQNSGNVMRSFALLNYFKSKGYQVDFVYSNDRWGGEIADSEIEEIQRLRLADHVFNIARKPSHVSKLSYFFTYTLPSLPMKIRRLFQERSIPEYAGAYTKKMFNKIIADKEYDYVIISYVFWANLIKNNRLIGKAKTIIDTHDFLTAQHQTDKRFNLGKGFSEEISRLRLFDEVWAISPEEQYIFSQFLGDKVRLIPFATENKALSQTRSAQKVYDLIYVAGDNGHNINAISWFFENVYPKLKRDVEILIIGRICEHIGSYPNVTKVPFAKDLEPYYRSAKVAICPMLTGTGIKIKVVEALSYGLPVVCSLRGTDGLLSKLENGCIISFSASEFASSISGLLGDDKLYRVHSEQGTHYAAIAHSPSMTYPTLNRCFAT